MKNKILPKNYKDFSTKILIKTWEEIKTPAGTKAPEFQILAMSELLREYRLGVFSVLKNPGAE